MQSENCLKQNNKKPPFAIIDMGSNSFRLCIFNDSESGASRKLKFIETCRMGEGFHENLEIQPAPFERCVDACKKYVEICRNHGVSKIYCFATATVREAKNRETFISACRDLGLEIHILSGEQEALCGFLGTCAGIAGIDNSKLESSGSKIAVLDIGGASTEIAIGNISGFKGIFDGFDGFPSIDEIREKSQGTYIGLDFLPIEFSHSFKVGAVRLTDKFGEDIHGEIAYLKEIFATCEKEINLENTACYGIGGTITAICGLIKKCENYKPELHGFCASTAELAILSTNICNMTAEERWNLPFLKDKRKEIIASGSVILATSLEYFNTTNITASLTDNLEGYRMYLGI